MPSQAECEEGSKLGFTKYMNQLREQRTPLKMVEKVHVVRIHLFLLIMHLHGYHSKRYLKLL
ncbi:hypothetical protein GOP47_0027151 [Adiantum capillus-veneris]|nr:hypothetical protein GOP47_0027151 [Adiantum capillus-veneris]